MRKREVEYVREIERELMSESVCVFLSVCVERERERERERLQKSK